MTETSLLWDNNGTGDASPHSESLVAAMFAAIAGAEDDAGVLRGVLNELAPSSINGDTQIRVASGWAVVDGHPYRNDANDDYTPTTPSVGTTGRRRVLRCDWAAQTVRLAEISSADGTATIPALTQTSGTTFEIPICSYTVTTGGSIGSFTDERVYAGTVHFERVGGDGTERTSNSTSNVDLATISGLSIQDNQHVIVRGVCRKADGVGQAAQLGLKINGSQRIANFQFTTTTLRNESGFFEIHIYPRATNYTFANVRMRAASAPNGSGVPTTDTEKTGGQSTGEITSITITGQTANSGITVGVDEINVYALAGAA